MTLEQIMKAWRGIPGHDIAKAMNQATFGVDWTRSSKRDIAEALLEKRHRLRPGFSVGDVATLARQRTELREKRKQEAAETMARIQRQDRRRQAATEAEFCGVLARQTTVSDFIRLAEKLWGALGEHDRVRFLRAYRK